MSILRTDRYIGMTLLKNHSSVATDAEGNTTTSNSSWFQTLIGIAMCANGILNLLAICLLGDKESGDGGDGGQVHASCARVCFVWSLHGPPGYPRVTDGGDKDGPARH